MQSEHHSCQPNQHLRSSERTPIEHEPHQNSSRYARFAPSQSCGPCIRQTILSQITTRSSQSQNKAGPRNSASNRVPRSRRHTSWSVDDSVLNTQWLLTQGCTATRLGKANLLSFDKNTLTDEATSTRERRCQSINQGRSRNTKRTQRRSPPKSEQVIGLFDIR